jgi:catechol 2,3-dioxygenase-like lactoylglutathione lyase family enzyme
VTVPSSPLGSSDVIAFAASADLDRSCAFYEAKLGLSLVERDDYACVFDAHGTMLRVTAVPKVASGGYTVLGWRVTDIDATVAQLAAAGVQFNHYDGMVQNEHGVWDTPSGDRVAWFPDPDGNVLSLTQFS